MTKILAGHQAPTFALNGANGQPFSLADALRKGPVVAAFFKISCPVCQFTLPFLERLYETYGDDRVSFVAISQDDKRDTKEFCAEYDLSLPTVLDTDGYPVSNQYGLTNVPAEPSFWHLHDANKLLRRLAAARDPRTKEAPARSTSSCVWEACDACRRERAEPAAVRLVRGRGAALLSPRCTFFGISSWPKFG